MKFVQTFDPTRAASGTIPVGTGDPGQKVLIYNESAVTLALNFDNGQTAYIHAWEANYWTLQWPLYEIEWSSVRNLTGAGQAPASFVDVFVYDAGEPIEGTYPAQLARLISVGNQVTPVATASSIVNDNNSANTQIIESTQSGASGSNVNIDNSGNMTISQYSGGALTALLQTIAGATTPVKIGTSTTTTEVKGALLVDGNATVVGTLNASGGLSVTGGLTVSTLNLTTGSLTRIQVMTGVLTSNGTSTTVNHSLGATPDIVILTLTVAQPFNSPIGLSVTSKSSTQFVVSQSSATNTNTFDALLIKV